MRKCLGFASVIDLSHKAPGASITVSDFAPYEPFIQAGARLLCRFDWDKRYPSPNYYQECPEISLELAEWLASRRIAVLGMDTPTPSLCAWQEVHVALLSAGVVIVEGLAHLAKLPPFGAFFIATPLRIRGGDGSPVRAIALVDRP